MSIVVHAKQDIMVGPKDWFTGDVEIDSLFKAEAPGSVSGAKVTFSPKARTAWHVHPKGQTLIVLEGTGYIQAWGEHRQEFKAGETVWIPANVKHWHGANEHGKMVHMAIQEPDTSASTVAWNEHVTDEQYSGK